MAKVGKNKKECRPVYQNELSIFEKETLLKIKEFRAARNNWMSSHWNQTKDADSSERLSESNLYKGRCAFLQWLGRKYILFYPHFKTLKPLRYYTLREKISDSQISKKKRSELKVIGKKKPSVSEKWKLKFKNPKTKPNLKNFKDKKLDHKGKNKYKKAGKLTFFTKHFANFFKKPKLNQNKKSTPKNVRNKNSQSKPSGVKKEENIRLLIKKFNQGKKNTCRKFKKPGKIFNKFSNHSKQKITKDVQTKKNSRDLEKQTKSKQIKNKAKDKLKRKETLHEKTEVTIPKKNKSKKESESRTLKTFFNSFKISEKELKPKISVDTNYLKKILRPKSGKEIRLKKNQKNKTEHGSINKDISMITLVKNGSQDISDFGLTNEQYEKIRKSL